MGKKKRGGGGKPPTPPPAASSAPQPSPQRGGWNLAAIIRGVLSAAALGFVVSFYISSLDAAGVKGLSLAYAYLAALWGVTLVGTLIAETFLSLKGRQRWTILALVMCGTTAVCVGTGYYEYRVHTEEFMLVPGTRDEVTLGCGARLNPVGVRMGTNWNTVTEFPFNLMVLNDRPIFILDWANEQMLIKKVILFDDRHDRIAEISDNVIWVRNDTKTDHPDKSTLIVYDHNAEVALKLEYLNKYALRVGGSFRNTAHPIFVRDDMMELYPPKGGSNHFRLKNNCFYNATLKQRENYAAMVSPPPAYSLVLYDGEKPPKNP